jgi:signal transduction histidine kinase/CheY-like chemotaxis protein
MAGVVASTAAGLRGSAPEPPMHAGELQEQLTLLCYMWVRAPLPVLAVCLYIAHLVWDLVPVALTLGWVAITLGPLTLRAWYAHRLSKDGRIASGPRRWARLLTVFAAVNGLLAGSAAPLFLGSIPPDAQAMMVMVMCCWGAGAIATNGAYPAAYHAFIFPLFAQMAAGWILFGARDTVYIVLLLATLFVVLAIFGRDNGRVLVRSIRLRHAYEQALAQKEELIGLLRSTAEEAGDARKKAEQANRAKSQFLASASHDLRQPLHALSLLTGVMNDVAKDPYLREVAQQMDRSVQSLDRLFGALLDLSKLDAGAVTVEPEDFDLADMLDRLSVEHRANAREKGLAFHLDCEPMWIHADPILLERITRNLLENAIRFTGAGSITVRAQSTLRDVLLTVSDTGVGVPPAEQERIFEEFFQLHNAGRDRSHGLGLGLSIVRRLVDMLGYELQLESSPGRGSSFTVRLPGALVERNRVTPAVVPGGVDDEMAALRNVPVLVLEDDVEVRTAMALLLRRWGCEPLIAASPAHALSLVASRDVVPQVILSDLRLADGASGVDAIEDLRARFGSLPAAIITGEISAERLESLQASGLPVLQKPLQAPALGHLLCRLIRQAAPRPA